MTKLTTSGVVRAILTNDPEMPIDQVIRQAKARGLRVPDEKIRHSIHNQRNTIRAQVAAVMVAPTAARETTPSKAVPAIVAPAATPASTSDLASVLSHVALVNAVVGMCGGIENTRHTAEVVQACGGVEAFLQHLELVALIRGRDAALEE